MNVIPIHIGCEKPQEPLNLPLKINLFGSVNKGERTLGKCEVMRIRSYWWGVGRLLTRIPSRRQRSPGGRGSTPMADDPKEHVAERRD